jgi:hypothetical protein
MAEESKTIVEGGEPAPSNPAERFPGLVTAGKKLIDDYVALYLKDHPDANPDEVRKEAAGVLADLQHMTGEVNGKVEAVLAGVKTPVAESKEAAEIPKFPTNILSFATESAKILRKERGMKKEDVLIGVPAEVLKKIGLEHGSIVGLTLDGKTPIELGGNLVAVNQTVREIIDPTNQTSSFITDKMLTKLTLPPVIRNLKPGKLRDHRENGTQEKYEKGEIDKKEDKGDPVDYSIVEIPGPEGAPVIAVWIRVD